MYQHYQGGEGAEHVPAVLHLTPCGQCRADQALLLLKKESELVRLQQDISKRVEEKITKDQRRYFLQVHTIYLLPAAAQSSQCHSGSK